MATQEQEMRRAEMEAAAAAYEAACGRYLESLKATDEETQIAADHVLDQLSDGDWADQLGWAGWVAEEIACQREWDEDETPEPEAPKVETPKQ